MHRILILWQIAIHEKWRWLAFPIATSLPRLMIESYIRNSAKRNSSSNGVSYCWYAQTTPELDRNVQNSLLVPCSGPGRSLEWWAYGLCGFSKSRCASDSEHVPFLRRSDFGLYWSGVGTRDHPDWPLPLMALVVFLGFGTTWASSLISANRTSNAANIMIYRNYWCIDL